MAIYAMLPEWLEILRRDCNHPSIIGWCPFNETGDLNDRKQYDELLRLVYRTIKAVDPGRPCIDSSGWFHVETDIFDVHNYDQEPIEFKGKYDRLATENVLFDNFPEGSSLLGRQQYAGNLSWSANWEESSGAGMRMDGDMGKRRPVKVNFAAA